MLPFPDYKDCRLGVLRFVLGFLRDDAFHIEPVHMVSYLLVYFQWLNHLDSLGKHCLVMTFKHSVDVLI